MKYLQRYIKTLSENVVEKKCIETSNSTYYTLDGGFKVRLSDHFSPVSVSSELHLEIIQIFDSEDFIILYRNFRSPMKKNRKEAKEFLKFAFDVYRMGKMASEQSRDKVVKIASDADRKKLCDDVIKTVEKKWKTYTIEINAIFEKHPNLLPMKKWSRYGSVLGMLSMGNATKEAKEVFRNYFETKKLDNKELLEVIYNIYGIEGTLAIDENKTIAYCEYMLKKKETTS